MSAPAPHPDRVALTQLVREVVADVLVLPANDVQPQSALVRDLGAESIDFLDLVFRLEERLGVRLGPDRWESFLKRRLVGLDPRVALTPEVVVEFAAEQLARP